MPYPAFLEILAWSYLSLCFLCCIWILLDQTRRPQKMWIMDLVWPITALYFGPAAIWLYRKTRPLMTKRKDKVRSSQPEQQHAASSAPGPDFIQISTAVSHCGAGCTLGDILGETLVPALAITFAGAFGAKLVMDFLFAYVFGIAFQYFTIAPMRGLPFGKALIAVLRADTISIALFEVGMFGWMALSYFVLFPSPHLKPAEPVFWFMMQIAMMVGFLTSYPANAWLLKKGWKEKMPRYAKQKEVRNDEPKAA